MERQTIANLTRLDLENTLKGGPFSSQWDWLCQEVGQDAARLLQLACSVTPSTALVQLAGLETEQSEVGAGFLGMLPSQIPDDLVVPNDLASSVAFAIQLAHIRNANLNALIEAMPQYALSFKGDPFVDSMDVWVPDGWELAVDFSAIRAILNYFSSDHPTWESALQIAGMTALQEMMKHRRDLGYVPEPLIDTHGLAWCLQHAASREPVDELWKWLHPQNLFDLSDLYTHREGYRAFIHHLEGNRALAKAILGRIAPFAPSDIIFCDQLSFAVGWGIRGWATTSTGGVNIEHLKDNYAKLVPTLIHETFHRLQTQLALANPNCDDPGFERVTSYPFPDRADRQLYQALCYIMLEGSATYVASTETGASWQKDADDGLDILRRIRELDDSQGDDACDSLISEGLRSNGPFYGFGALLSQAIVEQDGEKALGASLQAGAPTFMMHGFKLLRAGRLAPSAELQEQIRVLDQVIASV